MKEAPASARPADRSLAVFCDFDGTFSVQDVGSTLAREKLADRRRALWARFEQGEFTAWSYVVALFDGFRLPAQELERFLETIQLDPGARGLVDWCAREGVPFQVLSDGFDWNLDRLQAIHGVRFAYRANHLEYEGDVWRVSPGAPNPDCFCGTGTCKRGLIAAHRRAHPDAYCVHIGNGRVSDQCGALEADLVFAKDTLVDALRERGKPFLPFETLDDVRRALEAGGHAGRERSPR